MILKTGKEVDDTPYILSFYYQPLQTQLVISAFNTVNKRSCSILKIKNFRLKDGNYREQDRQLKSILKRITVDNNQLQLTAAAVILCKSKHLINGQLYNIMVTEEVNGIQYSARNMNSNKVLKLLIRQYNREALDV